MLKLTRCVLSTGTVKLHRIRWRYYTVLKWAISLTINESKEEKIFKWGTGNRKQERKRKKRKRNRMDKRSRMASSSDFWPVLRPWSNSSQGHRVSNFGINSTSVPDHKPGLRPFVWRTLIRQFNQLELKWRPKLKPWRDPPGPNYKNILWFLVRLYSLS